MSPILKATLIYNPLAGSTRTHSAVAAVIPFWRRQGWELTVEATTHAGHATELARQAAVAGQQLVLVAGGDGTLSEAASGLAGTETIMAPLPSGTANSLSNELRLPGPGWRNGHSLLPAAQALAAGRVQRMDLGQCDDGRYCLLWSGSGLDGFLVKAIEPRSRRVRRLGKVAYVALSLWHARRFPGMRATVEIDDRTFRDDFLMVTVNNSRLYAGHLRLSPRAALDDGQFEVWMFRGRTIFEALRYVAAIFLQRHLDDKNVEVVNGRCIRIATKPVMPYHRDGDPAGQTPYSVTLRPAALRLLVPVTAPGDLFVGPGESLPAPS